MKNNGESKFGGFGGFGRLGRKASVAAALVTALGGTPGCTPLAQRTTPQYSWANQTRDYEWEINEYLSQILNDPNQGEDGTISIDQNALQRLSDTLLEQYENLILDGISDDDYRKKAEVMMRNNRIQCETIIVNKKIGEADIGNGDKITLGNNGFVIGNEFWPISNLSDFHDKFFRAYILIYKATLNDKIKREEVTELSKAIQEWEKNLNKYHFTIGLGSGNVEMRSPEEEETNGPLSYPNYAEKRREHDERVADCMFQICDGGTQDEDNSITVDQNAAQSLADALLRQYDEFLCEGIRNDHDRHKAEIMMAQMGYYGEPCEKIFVDGNIGLGDIGDGKDIKYGENGVIIGDKFYEVPGLNKAYKKFCDAYSKVTNVAQSDTITKEEQESALNAVYDWRNTLCNYFLIGVENSKEIYMLELDVDGDGNVRGILHTHTDHKPEEASQILGGNLKQVDEATKAIAGNDARIEVPDYS